MAVRLVTAPAHASGVRLPLATVLFYVYGGGKKNFRNRL